MVVTGIDTASSRLQSVESISLHNVMGQDTTSKISFDLAEDKPKRNTYLRMDKTMPEEPFVVVYEATDDQGKYLKN